MNRSKFSRSVGKYKSIIFRGWKAPAQVKEFDELQDKLLAGSRQTEDKIKAFWGAYIQMAKEYGELEGVEVPEEYEAPPDEPLDALLKKSESTNIVADFLWAYEAARTAVIEEAPSAGAWFFFDMRKNNKNKFADLTLRILDRLAAQQDEQKSREADYTKAMGLLEGAAEKHFPGKRLGDIRTNIRRGAKRIREQSALSSESN
jgi:hypothetical protein